MRCCSVSHVSGVEGHAWAEVCTEVGVWAGRASHHGHRLAAVGAHGGGREAGAEGLAALAEVLNGAVDLCGYWSALPRLCLRRGLSLPCRVALALTDPTAGTTYPQTAKQRHWRPRC